MNARYHVNHTTKIARLADQAHDESNIIYNQRLETQRADEVIFYDIFNQRFAELIIEECVNVIQQQDRIPTGFLYAKGSNAHEVALRTHFGVEG